MSVLRRSLLHATVSLCLFVVSGLYSQTAFAGGRNDWRYQESHSDSREFAAGGKVHVHLGVGDLRIRRGDSDKIRLHYTIKSRDKENLKDARVDFDVRGNDAELEFHASGHDTSFEIELEVPSQTSLDVNEKVGDLRIENVEGDKDLELGVGDIRVLKSDKGYHLIRASAGVGDVHGRGETSGWLGKTLRYRGDGKYELRAHVGVGDIWIED